MSSKTEILIFETSFTLTNCLVKKWIELANRAVSERGKFVVALSGGKSPVEFFCRLSTIKDYNLWDKTHIFLADERCVPLSDPDSNLYSIKDNLLNYIDIPEENVHQIITETSNINDLADQYQRKIRDFFRLQPKEFPVFDLMLLGIGEDGHTASLFPGNNAVLDTQHLAVAVINPKTKHYRISLTLPVINHSRDVIFVAVGQFKSEVIKKVIEEKADLPATKVSPVEGRITYYLDKGSARKLSIRDQFTHKDEAISIIK